MRVLLALGQPRRASWESLRRARRKCLLRRKLSFHELEDRTLLSTIVWDSTDHPKGGSWDVAANWVGGVLPGSSNDVVIDLTAAGTVTLGTGVTDTVKSLMTNANTSISITTDTLALASTSSIGGGVNVTQGTLNVNSGSLSVGGALTQSGSVNIAAGTTLTTSGAYTQSSGTTTLASGGMLTSSANGVAINGGTLAGSGTITGSVTNAGNIVPGGTDAAGILTITGNYTQTSGGTLTVSLSGTAPGSDDGELVVSGKAALGGNLNLNLFGGYIPNDGDQYVVLGYGSSGTHFANITYANFPDGTTVTPTYNSSDLTLVANVPPPVDFGKLDTDLTTHLSNIQSSVDSGLKQAVANAVPIPIIGQSLTSVSPITSGLGAIIQPLIAAFQSIQGIAENSPKLGSTIQSAVYAYLSAGVAGNPGVVTLADLNDQNNGGISQNDVIVQTGLDQDHTFSVEVLVTVTNPASIGFSLGLGNFLTLKSTFSLPFQLTTDYLLSFKFDPTTNTFTPDNTANLAGQPEAPDAGILPDVPLAVTLDLESSSTSASSATGQLAGLLYATVSDAGSSFMAALGVGLDSDDNASLTLTGSATAHVEVSLTFGNPSDNTGINPTISTGLDFNVSFDSSSLEGGSSSSPFGDISPITVEAVSVSLNLEFLNPILSAIQTVTEPLQPIINILDAQVPGLNELGIHETLIGLLLGVTGNGDEQTPVQDFLNLVTDINQFHIN